MDPETGLDAVRNVGIRDGKDCPHLVRYPGGRRVIHADGLVVAPGFVEVFTSTARRWRASAWEHSGGVTTALELEIGAPDVAQFLGKRMRGSFAHSLRHLGQPSGGAGYGIRNAVAARRNPAEERLRHRSSPRPGANHADRTAPAFRNRMRADWPMANSLICSAGRRAQGAGLHSCARCEPRRSRVLDQIRW